jgi:hypothetical protein
MSNEIKTALVVAATILAVAYINQKAGNPLARLLPA